MHLFAPESSPGAEKKKFLEWAYFSPYKVDPTSASTSSLSAFFSLPLSPSFSKVPFHSTWISAFVHHTIKMSDEVYEGAIGIDLGKTCNLHWTNSRMATH